MTFHRWVKVTVLVLAGFAARTAWAEPTPPRVVEISFASAEGGGQTSVRLPVPVPNEVAEAKIERKAPDNHQQTHIAVKIGTRIGEGMHMWLNYDVSAQETTNASEAISLRGTVPMPEDGKPIILGERRGGPTVKLALLH
jgi:hypothetical protein